MTNSLSTEDSSLNDVFPIMLVGLFSFVFYTSMFYISPLLPSIIVDFGTTYVETSSLMALLFIPQIFFSIFASPLISRFGLKKTATAGMLLILLGTILFAFDTLFIVLQVARFIIGTGVALAFVATMTFVTIYFGAENRGFVSGIIGMTYSLSIVVSFNLFGWINTTANYQTASWAMFLFACGAATIILAKCNIFASAGLPENRTNEKPKLIDGLKNRDMRLIGFMWLAVNMGMGSYLTWVKVFLIDYKGFTPAMADLLASFIMMLGILRPFVGKVSDKLRRRKIFVNISTLGYGISILILPFLNGFALYSVFGIMSIAGVFIAPAVLALPGDVMKEKAQVGYGILNTSANIGYLIGPVITAWFFDNYGLFVGFLTIGVFFSLSFIFSALLKVK